MALELFTIYQKSFVCNGRILRLKSVLNGGRPFQSMSNLEKILLLKRKRFMLKVETSGSSADYAKYEELRNEIWGFPEDNLPGTRNMMCESYLHEGSSLFIAVYEEKAGGDFREDRESLVGFSYGFVGVKDKSVAFKSLDNLWFYSQYTGVRTCFQGRGLGTMIKEYQREILRDVFGVYTVTCTYDPLTGVNAHRNVRHFGMKVLEYRPATYGEYGGLLNRTDVPSDRFFMSWDLRAQAERPALRLEAVLDAGRQVIHVEHSKVPGRTRAVELEVVKDVKLEADALYLIIPIPLDYYLMLRETDVADPAIRRIPVEWRMSTRRAFQGLFAKGYEVIDFQKVESSRPRNLYVLKQSS
jgi:predicted GNAT superfamily acetyltransferase